MTVYFDKKGRGCTEEVAKLALQRGAELGIEHFVVASNTGFTARHFVGKAPNLVCVTHHIGFREPGGDEMSQETRKESTSCQGSVITCMVPILSGSLQYTCASTK